MGDPFRIGQILSNLIGNAIKFTECGRVEVRVETQSETDEALELHFAVSDTGIGIPPEKQEEIFERFTQVDMSPTRKHGGLGLGLTICSELVKKMGGRIWVESEIGVWEHVSLYGSPAARTPGKTDAFVDTRIRRPVQCRRHESSVNGKC